MGVYNNYSPLGVDSTPNLRMGARMPSLGTSSFLLIRISCLDSVRPIEGWSPNNSQHLSFPLQYRAPNQLSRDRPFLVLAGPLPPILDREVPLLRSSVSPYLY